MKPPRLDARLRVVADCVPHCALAADIGADHGKLTAWLLYHKRCERMIASDISAASRAKARALFHCLGLSERVTISDAEGLHALAQPAQAVIISGLGGGTIADMLAQDVDLNGAALILSPHTELPRLRDALSRRSYRLTKELVVKAEGRFYQVWQAVPGEMRLTEKERALGINLGATFSAVPADYLRWQLKVTRNWHGAEAVTLRGWIKERIADEEGDHSGSL
ncbi:MAG: tRNA (adenine(22)-N(1))-methyltransferase TrmK [Eubacteriales bacterium]|nr:tRNA (adenine(22)-N(1))-methyltransferase TrmK [Eubacteriales bacterium]